jgi:anaerobic magnesium-protoporphyrin IX monomethyl ester cyclase
MTKVTLVYPYFHPRADTSIFRFPPLGLGYIAAYLKQNDFSAEIVDCTFLNQAEALQKIKESKAQIIGIQSMYSMRKKSLELAELLRNSCELLVAGGALPTTEPSSFLGSFDLAVVGEGEQTMLEIAQAFESGRDYTKIHGLAYIDKASGQTRQTTPRSFINNLDLYPPPLRSMFDNQSYQKFYQNKFGYKTTAIMTSRGCPFSCDFCSRPVFGNTFRARSAEKVVDEIEEVEALGYDRVWFADDCFTLNRQKLFEVCHEILRRDIQIGWECLSRVDTLDSLTAQKMKQAGCIRTFFGLESGNDAILKLMNKQITTKQARLAVETCRTAGIKTGAFFILGYPGENAQTILETVKFASSLPLDYLSFTMPYPIPGTPLYERLSDRLFFDEWEEPKNIQIVKHKLLFDSQVSEVKMKFAIVKGMGQFYLRKYTGDKAYQVLGRPLEAATDMVYRKMS